MQPSYLWAAKIFIVSYRIFFEIASKKDKGAKGHKRHKRLRKNDLMIVYALSFQIIYYKLLTLFPRARKKPHELF